MTTKKCLRCRGTGEILLPEFIHDGKRYSNIMHRCPWCDGMGYFVPPSAAMLTSMVMTHDGKRLCKVHPEDIRAYYVWRMARFHGGQDTKIPVIALAVSEADPYKDELDTIARTIAVKVYGTDIAGAMSVINSSEGSAK